MCYIMVFIKSDILSMNKIDIQVFLLSRCSIKRRLLFREFFKKIKKRFIIFLQILKTQKFRCFKEKFSFFKMESTSLCLKEKLKKKIYKEYPHLRRKTKFFFQTKYFFLHVLSREFCTYVSFILIFLHLKLI